MSQVATDPEAAAPSALVVDDDAALLDIVTLLLERHGFHVAGASTRSRALRALAEDAPDLVILDLGLRGGGDRDTSGEELCTRIRRISDVPILVLSGRRDGEIKARLLDRGADDYLTKPFAGDELVARARALLRRGPLPSPRIEIEGGLCVDPARWHASVRGRPIHLSPTQFRLLALLAKRAGDVVTRAELLSVGWPRGVTDAYALKPQLAALRRRLAEADGPPLVNVRGVGYRLLTITEASR